MNKEDLLLATEELEPGLTTSAGERGDIQLIGHRCLDCGTRFFPARMRCVSCFGANTQPIELERTGLVDAFTIVRQAPPGYYGPVPYVLAMVTIGNDVITLTQLSGKPVNEWQRGDTVASYACSLPNADGKQLSTYTFRPATPEDIAQH